MGILGSRRVEKTLRRLKIGKDTDPRKKLMRATLAPYLVRREGVAQMLAWHKGVDVSVKKAINTLESQKHKLIEGRIDELRQPRLNKVKALIAALSFGGVWGSTRLIDQLPDLSMELIRKSPFHAFTIAAGTTFLIGTAAASLLYGLNKTVEIKNEQFKREYASILKLLKRNNFYVRKKRELFEVEKKQNEELVTKVVAHLLELQKINRDQLTTLKRGHLPQKTESG